MRKVKVAILEDSPLLLKELRKDLIDTGLVEVIVYASTSEELSQKLINSKAEAMILDIDLHGENVTGIDIANHHKLPTLFISGKTKDFLTGIEAVNYQHDFPVEFITKPASGDRLFRALEKFTKRVIEVESQKYVVLDFKGSRSNKINVDDIVFLCSNKDKGSASNNKEIFFRNRKPELLIDFSLVHMEKHGLSASNFIKTHGSYRVNVKAIQSYETSTHSVRVQYVDDKGEWITKSLPVSENYRRSIRVKLAPDLLL